MNTIGSIKLLTDTYIDTTRKYGFLHDSKLQRSAICHSFSFNLLNTATKCRFEMPDGFFIRTGNQMTTVLATMSGFPLSPDSARHCSRWQHGISWKLSLLLKTSK